jgi:hypothetical protein
MNKLTVGQLMAILGRLDPDLGIDTIANNHIARSGGVAEVTINGQRRVLIGNYQDSNFYPPRWRGKPATTNSPILVRDHSRLATHRGIKENAIAYAADYREGDFD